MIKAMVYTRYGGPEVLHIKELEKPAPEQDQVLVKVMAASLNYGDWGLLKGKPSLLRLTDGDLFTPKNRILGGDIAGRVEAVGENVEDFQPGRRSVSSIHLNQLERPGPGFENTDVKCKNMPHTTFLNNITQLSTLEEIMK